MAKSLSYTLSKKDKKNLTLTRCICSQTIPLLRIKTGLQRLHYGTLAKILVSKRCVIGFSKSATLKQKMTVYIQQLRQKQAT